MKRAIERAMDELISQFPPTGCFFTSPIHERRALREPVGRLARVAHMDGSPSEVQTAVHSF